MFVWQDDQYDILKPFHFSLQELHHMITTIYPSSISDDKLGRFLCDLCSVIALVFSLYDYQQLNIYFNFVTHTFCGIC